MRPPRLVATDLDGTLLRSDGSVSRYTVDVVRAVQAAGIEFVLATARPPRWLHELTDLVGDHGLAVCGNGAFVYDVRRREVVAERAIDPGVVIDIVGDLRRALPGIAFAVERRDGFGREPGYVPLHPTPPDVPVAPLEELLEPPPGKLLARAPHLDGVRFLEQVTRLVGDRAVVAFSGAGGLAEISGAGVTKAVVLAQWCTERGIGADEVWAFGDMPNDLAMLAWAGTSFAVANAHPDVAAVTTHRCRGNDEDGVATALAAMLGSLSR